MFHKETDIGISVELPDEFLKYGFEAYELRSQERKVVNHTILILIHFTQIMVTRKGNSARPRSVSCFHAII
jgi:hypothetical protein